MPENRRNDRRREKSPRRRTGANGAAPPSTADRPVPTAPQVRPQAALSATSSSGTVDARMTENTSSHRDLSCDDNVAVTQYSSATARAAYDARPRRASHILQADPAEPGAAGTPPRYAQRTLENSYPQSLEQYYTGPQRRDAADAQSDDESNTESESGSDDDEEEDILAEIDSPVYGRFSGVQAAYYSPQAREASGTTYYRAQALTFHVAPFQPVAPPEPREPEAHYTWAPRAISAQRARQLVARPARPDLESQTPRSMRRPSDPDPPRYGYPPRRH
nr:hypothetical protein B0A51_12670 [Rachicladosporium sp. CCFEE 5018]